MYSLPGRTPASPYRARVERSQWLRDLAAALDRADRLTGDLADDPAAALEVAAIRARIGQVRATLALVRAGRADEIDPNWLKLARALARWRAIRARAEGGAFPGG